MVYSNILQPSHSYPYIHLEGFPRPFNLRNSRKFSLKIHLKIIIMSTPVILISILLIMAVFVPFFILNNSGKGEAKLISKKIKEIVKEDRLKFDVKESWGNTFIAIDRAKKIIVFSKTVKDEVTVEKIALDQVEKSTIQKKLKLEKT